MKLWITTVKGGRNEDTRLKSIQEDLVETFVSPYHSALLLVPKKIDNDEEVEISY